MKAKRKVAGKGRGIFRTQMARASKHRGSGQHWDMMLGEEGQTQETPYDNIMTQFLAAPQDE